MPDKKPHESGCAASKCRRTVAVAGARLVPCGLERSDDCHNGGVSPHPIGESVLSHKFISDVGTCEFCKLRAEIARLKRLVAELEQKCDPSGDTQALIMLKDTCAAQEARVKELEQQIRDAPCPLSHFQVSLCLRATCNCWKRKALNLPSPA